VENGEEKMRVGEREGGDGIRCGEWSREKMLVERTEEE
jgi:hypothetical protein